MFGASFSTPETAAIWSDKQRTAYYLQFEGALANVQAKLVISKHCESVSKLDFDELREQTKLIGYPILPVVQQLVRNVNAVEDGLGEWAHWGTMTQDVMDTSVVLQLREPFRVIEDAPDSIIDCLEHLCVEHRSTPMAARSHLQQAVPMSLGFKLARLLASFQRHKQRLHKLKPRLFVLQFGGAAGTLATITSASSFSAPDTVDGIPLALRCQELLAAVLDLGVPETAWHAERDNFAEAANILALLTATCAKFGTDLMLMMQTEVSEAKEPYSPHRGSSSTMPQKRNPIGSAYICAMASTVLGLASNMVVAIVADHERSTGPLELEWIVLPQLCALSHACLKQTLSLLNGIEVDGEAMKRNLALSKGAVVSEAVMMGLGKTIGRQYAHDLVYGALSNGTAIKQLIVGPTPSNTNIKRAGLTNEQLGALCDPANYLGLSEVMVDRILKKPTPSSRHF
ncbi:hypothetical protein BAUCODRAFT_120175 [Baudoinia panamericana UAMH 10762]|uniref:Adenylosuccinate lyase C-terminal domain-containing protein n=1 Tax=Baudoinia panamericana (strain UAMH 10762) TaxID=717646 RepID=M2N4G9_BAUPA|nr:uncharacterized protein BAUCODRAFT_120175 [Baudoinia panamericana UAMH 10762]EMC98883.1 hypothetical protein BAUCODRAFT_120175 [Baudoinia panamericana UAMH 10762]